MFAKYRCPIAALSGLALFLIALLVLYLSDQPLWHGKQLRFLSPQGDSLSATYYPGQLPYGIMLLEGFGSDQTMMRPAASEFARLGVHIFTFDFWGHGRSAGTLAFDNAATDRLARQALAAKEQFKTLSGLQDSQIILLGHSLGARVALQAATMDAQPVAGLILLGAQVNLLTNVQAEFFTGTYDGSLEWVQALSQANPPVKILLISGRWDDILTPAAARALHTHLSRTQLVLNQAAADPAPTGYRDLVILEGLVHNYEPYSPRLLALAKRWAGQAWDMPQAVPAQAPTAARRIAWWVVGLMGLLAALLGGAGWAGAALSQPAYRPAAPQITNLRRFLWSKLLLWLAALPVAVLLCGAFFFIPLGAPVFNLIYVGFIGSYGIVLYLLYRFGRMPGVSGRLPFFQDSTALPTRSGWLAPGIGFLLLVLTAVYFRTGLAYVFPLNVRLFWLALFTPFTALGFWAGAGEMQLLTRLAPERSLSRVLSTLIGFLPFFLWTGFLAAIGSISGVLGGLQGLLVLALVLLSGTLLQRLGARPWGAALYQAVLLYWLILPSGVLFK